MTLSKYAYVVCISILAYTNLSFYPKWEKGGSEAALSWDVCGYYYYLPAIFIYKDIKKVAFHAELDKKYRYQDDDFYAALPSINGNLVMKYSSGMALMYSPAFFLAHVLAKPLGFVADGFSPIYQFAISFWSVLWAFVGLWYLRKLLLKLNFSEGVTASILMLYVLATNYVEYAGISSPQAHSYIFTLYSILFFTTIRFYENPSVKKALGIGLCMGLAILARPTEMITIALPVLWGVYNKATFIERFNFIKTHFSKYALAILMVVSIGSIQVIYWKLVAGYFIYDSYGKTDFMEWKKPHILDGLFSARRGWLIYSPIFLFAIAGFCPLYKTRKELFLSLFLFFILFIYVSFSHNIWWYGGGLSQRQMIQMYPLLAIPFAAFLTMISQNLTRQILFGIAASVCIYLNIWLVWHGHKEGGLWRDDVTPAYLRRIIGRWDVPIETMKLLDNKYDFTGEKRDVEIIYDNNLELDTSQNVDFQNIINGKRSLFVDEAHPMTTHYKIGGPLSIKGKKWLRATIIARSTVREWTDWRMPAFIVDFQKNGESVKYFQMRPHRILEKENEQKTLWLDIKIPSQSYDNIVFWMQNSGSNRKVVIDDIKFEAFNE
jgi:hypothetical protein